jgi:hypothetical protein
LAYAREIFLREKIERERKRREKKKLLSPSLSLPPPISK